LENHKEKILKLVHAKTFKERRRSLWDYFPEGWTGDSGGIVLIDLTLRPGADSQGERHKSASPFQHPGLLPPPGAERRGRRAEQQGHGCLVPGLWL